MNDSWDEVAFGDLAAPIRNAIVGGPFGSNLVSNDYVDSGVPVIRGQNMVGRWVGGDFVYVSEEKAASLSGNLARAGDLIFTQRGTLGQVSIVPEGAHDRYLVSQSQMKATVDEARADVRFLYYFFSSEAQQDWIRSNAIQTGVPHTNLGILKKHSILLPSLPEQRSIAGVLSSLDDKIEQNRRTGRALEELTRATFKAWFVDFEPIKAKATGQASFPGMSPAAFAAIPARLTGSPLGPVPEGWAVQPVGDIAMLSKQQIDPQAHSDESFEHFSIPSFDAGRNPVIESGGGIRSQKFVVVPGCVLLSKLNPRIARVWLPSPSTGLRQIASTEFLVVVPRAGWIRETVYCLFQQEDFRKSLAQSASGTSNSHQRVRPADLLARPIVAPSQPILDVFAEQVVPQMALCEALHKESSKLAALRDYLLPRLLSGRVRVPSSSLAE